MADNATITFVRISKSGGDGINDLLHFGVNVHYAVMAGQTPFCLSFAFAYGGKFLREFCIPTIELKVISLYGRSSFYSGTSDFSGSTVSNDD